MFNLGYAGLAAVAAALVLTLVLAAYLTPSHWWRQLNLRAIAIVVLGTWGIASLIMWFVPGANAPLMAHAASAPTAGVSRPVAPLQAGLRYRVHDDLNLRAAKGTAARRIALVPAGSVVTTTGVRDGDWWQVNTRIDGKDVRGWSSSLWLRRADEG